MNDGLRLALVALLTPIVWILIQHYIVPRLNSLARKTLPTKLAAILTRRYGK